MRFTIAVATHTMETGMEIDVLKMFDEQSKDIESVFDVTKALEKEIGATRVASLVLMAFVIRALRVKRLLTPDEIGLVFDAAAERCDGMAKEHVENVRTIVSDFSG